MIQSIGRRQFRIFPGTCTHGSYVITMPKGLDTKEDVRRVFTQLFDTPRASTLPRWKENWFEDCEGTRVKIKYEGFFTPEEVIS
jgi:hypothetical protein